MGRRLLEPLALAGSATVLIATTVLASRWDPITAGHPSYQVFYGIAIALGVSGVIVVLWREDRRRPVLSTLAAIGLAVVGFGAWWLAPFPADPVAVEALSDPQGYSITESASSIILQPEVSGPGVSFTFYPGARVDARAYARILAPLAQEGYEVRIVKPPLGIALLVFGIDRPADADAWVLGGHSLGGVAASTRVGEDTDGLVLWASFPASDISDHPDLRVTSIYGTADTFATPEDIADSRPDLPTDAEFIAIEGGVHSFFGDYGLQPGDGEPAITREEAQKSIVAASLDLMGSVEIP
jgi:hypothetical protein